jgi:hypothetical protein
MLIISIHFPQALEIQGKRTEALDELVKICRIHNVFPPEENSVCILLFSLPICFPVLLFSSFNPFHSLAS